MFMNEKYLDMVVLFSLNRSNKIWKSLKVCDDLEIGVKGTFGKLDAWCNTQKKILFKTLTKLK